jgi:crooked neck
VGIDVATNKEERLMLLEAWRDFELQYGDDSSRHAVNNLLPKRVKKRRRIQTQDGSDAGWEEFFDYIFPEDEASKHNLKLVAMAKAWKKGVDTTLVQEQAPDTSKDTNNEPDRDQPDDPNTQDDRDDSSDSSGSDSEED